MINMHMDTKYFYALVNGKKCMYLNGGLPENQLLADRLPSLDFKIQSLNWNWLLEKTEVQMKCVKVQFLPSLFQLAHWGLLCNAPI